MERIKKMDQKGVPDSQQGRGSMGRRGSSVPPGEVDATSRFEQKSILVLPTVWSGASTSTMPLNARTRSDEMKFQDIWFDARVESCATASCSTGHLGVFDLNIPCASVPTTEVGSGVSELQQNKTNAAQTDEKIRFEVAFGSHDCGSSTKDSASTRFPQGRCRADNDTYVLRKLQFKHADGGYDCSYLGHISSPPNQINSIASLASVCVGLGSGFVAPNDTGTNERMHVSDAIDLDVDTPAEHRSGTHTFDLNIIPEGNHLAVCCIANDTTDDNNTVSSTIVPAMRSKQVPWKKRNTKFEGAEYRDPVPGKQSALQQALMKFADRRNGYVINPTVGTEFDNCDEGYEYYNLYSWECGFGIRWGKKRWSEKKCKNDQNRTKRYQLGQEFYCSCRGNADPNVKTSSSKTNCKAMLRLYRTSNDGWIVGEHISEHNHPLSETCGEKKHWPSHHHLDKYTKDLIRMLRENNIGITKLYTILGNFLGRCKMCLQ
ncbi:uncharacterized protein LOC120695376 [Panicum virgatum]|uniref:uncharacterized protein LOC120695376 n=1 Tax=Panicum virgatum TaxID=38727 RepID=UPI0019D540A4|nr:uncharacterized protein LOC120695376 [Panicum virgatum]